MPEWLGILLFCGLLFPALLVNVLIYPYLMQWALNREGELSLTGALLTASRGQKKLQIDLNRPHSAKIEAGASATGWPHWASLQISQETKALQIHLNGILREQVLEAFPEPFFVGRMPITPYEGSWGFQMGTINEGAQELFLALLGELWWKRENNERYRLFQKFPWGKSPAPAFRHILIIKAEDMDPETKRLIREIEEAAVSVVYPWLKLTPDYLLAERGTPEKPYYYLMPLGFIRVKPRGAESSESNWAELVVSGRDERGNKREICFDWPYLIQDAWEEAQMCEAFINSRTVEKK